MNTNKTQSVLSSLLFDLFILNGSILMLARVYPDIRLLNFQQLFSLFLILNSSFILTFFNRSKNWYYLRPGFLCRLKKFGLKFLTYFLISSLLVLIFLPIYHLPFFFKHSGLFFTGITIIYWLNYWYFILKRAIGFNIQRVAIISKCKTSLLIERIIKSNPSLGYKFVGFLSDNKSGKNVLGSLPDLEEIIPRHHIQSIISVENLDQFLVSTCDRLGVKLGVVPNIEKKNLINSKYTTGVKMIRIHPMPLDNILLRTAKRSFDILFSLSAIVFLLSWLIPLLALIIKVSSKGPVFFTQKRTGINNSTFTCYKFRSMVVNPLSDIKQASGNDSRITAVGKFIRKTNIDELPQFFNVLMGHMSVIGPRPHMLKHTQFYSKKIEYYLRRHYIKPGITGWAQVNGLRGETDELWKMEKRVEYDLHYIENWTLLWDLKIILLTLFPHKISENLPPVTVPSQIPAINVISNITINNNLQKKKNKKQVKEPAF